MSTVKKDKRSPSYQEIQRIQRQDPQDRVTQVSAAFSGPLPAPSTLEGYERIIPGAADRIILLAEMQSQHRQELEKSVIRSNIQLEYMGMWIAFGLTIALMILGAVLIILNKDTAGYFAIFSPVVFHAGNYLYNKRKEQRGGEK